MVCSLQSQRTAEAVWPEAGPLESTDFPAMEPLLSFTKHTLHGLIFCLFAPRAPISPRMNWHWGWKAARNKSIDWFPEGILVSTPTGTESVLPSLLRLAADRSPPTSRGLPHRRRSASPSSTTMHSQWDDRRGAQPANSLQLLTPSQQTRCVEEEARARRRPRGRHNNQVT